MASNQAEECPKIFKLHSFAGAMSQKFGSTSDLKQKRERFWSHHRLVFINLSLCVHELWHIHIHQ